MCSRVASTHLKLSASENYIHVSRGGLGTFMPSDFLVMQSEETQNNENMIQTEVGQFKHLRFSCDP